MKNFCCNPILPGWEYTPDVEPRVFGDRLYLYGSHDAFNADNFCPNDYVGWSAPLSDLSDWRFGGVTYPASADPANADGTQRLFAPDCVQGGDGRYYLYYCLNNTSRIGVAVSDRPEGPFSFYGYVTEADGTPFGVRYFAFDPGVLVEEDGRVWLYSGFAPTGDLREQLTVAGRRMEGCYCVELAPDLLTCKGEPVLVLPGRGVEGAEAYQGHAFFEASSPRRINGKYYLIYSSELSHELCWAVSERPNGGFRYGGILVSIGDLGLNGNPVAKNYLGNTHGGLVELNGQWYVVYHRQTNKTMFSRQCCAERVTIRSDGTILQAELTSMGFNGAPLAGRGVIPARCACHLSSKDGAVFVAMRGGDYDAHPCFTQSGGDREEDDDQHIANLRDGSWCAFKYLLLDGAQTITLTTKGSGTGCFTVSTSENGGVIAQVPVTPSADWQTSSAPFSAEQGKAALYLTYHGTGSVDLLQFELN